MPPAPYWGDLSGPKAARRQRRQSEDFSLPERMSPEPVPSTAAATTAAAVDKPLPPHPPKSNRTSLQTTNTEAYTESTLSPFASPTASSVADQGLAPRPPTFPYGESQYPEEPAERRQRRRRERNGDDRDEDPDQDSLSAPTPPAAPDVPKAPPVSFRHPYGNGGLPYTHPAPSPARTPRQPSPLVGPEDEMNPEEYYKDPAPERQQQDLPPLDRSQRTLDVATETRPPREPREPREPQSSSRRRSAGGSGRDAQRRKASMGDSSRKFANDRSPLQRLESKLDTITKEEKRARVEAAERRAREKAAAKAAQNPDLLQPPEASQRAPRQHPKQEPQRPLPEPPVQQVQVHQVPVQQVRFRDERYDDNPHVQQHANVAASRGPPAQYYPEDEARYAPRQSLDDRRQHQQHMPESHRRHASGPYPSRGPAMEAMEVRRPPPSSGVPQRSVSLREPPSEPAVANSGIPKRNLSFRERAAKDNMKLPQAADPQNPDDSPEPTPPVAGSRRPSFSLTRSGSNKLKKQPKGDPWFSIRKDAEKKYENIEFRNAAMDQSAAEKGGPPVQRSVSHATREQALPPDATIEEARQTRMPSKAAKLIGIDFGGVQRRSTAPAAQHYDSDSDGEDPRYEDPRRAPVASGGRGDGYPHATHGHAAARGRPTDREYYSEDDGFSDDSRDLYPAKKTFRPGEGIYKPPVYLDEWKKATVGSLCGNMLDLSEERLASIDKDTPWWEGGREGGKRRESTSRPRKAEAFDGEYDDTHDTLAPTRFKPPLFLKCGPLLRYCGLKHEKVPARNRNIAVNEKTIWRGSVMIVTQDSDSSYEIAPTLRLFVQPIELLPPPPQEISGEQGLPPEYVDPIAGIPKLGRRGETLYVRPVEHLDEAKDLSRDETDNGLFEKTRSPPDYTPPNGSPDLPGSFASRRKRVEIDGEKVSKYKDVRGFRLHAERGCTFWRFNIEIELREKQQRIAYRINRGPAMGFWVPAVGQSMNIMFHSCNGFSASVNPDDFSGPDPMWRDVLNTHQSQPFHVMIGGGDQIYNDCLMDQSKQFREWLAIKNPLHKHNSPFTLTMQDELERAYLERYCMWFSQGLFGLANSQIPMVNMWDDHDISDGFGSYAHHDMNSPVFSGLGNVAYKYYMLFQHQSIPSETDATEPSWVLGSKPGPYISELSRSLFVELGSNISLLAVDGRTERTELDVVSEPSWQKIMDRCYEELRTGRTKHLLVLLGVPIAYPRLVWLENILTSRAMDPVKALGKLGMLGNTLNHIDGGVEVLDDLNDHWTAKNHKKERTVVIQDMQDLAADKSVRVTFLSGDVHLAAVGQFYANPKLGLPKHKDFRYMPNVVSSAIVNTPPPDLMADILNKRNKIHHFDESTDEDMIPLFHHGVDGKARNNKHLLPHRNWCSIREWTPGTTPPPTPPLSAYDRSPSPPASRGGLLRRFSSNRGPAYRPDVQRDESRSRPPISNNKGKAGGLFRSLSRRNSTDGGRPTNVDKPKRSLSLTRVFSLGRRSSKKSQPDDGGINGQWGDEDSVDGSVDDGYYGYDDEYDRRRAPRSRGMGLRGGGGGGHDEYQSGDDSYFTARPAARMRGAPIRGGPDSEDEFSPGDESQFTAHPPPRAYTMGDERQVPRSQEILPRPKAFHRTPTGMSVKQKKKADAYEVDLEGGLDICLNVEVNQKDPTGITVPYRLLVPRLIWDDAKEAATVQPPAPSGFKRMFSMKKKDAGAVQPQEPASEEQFEGSVKQGSIRQGSLKQGSARQSSVAPSAGREPVYDAPPKNARYESPGGYDSARTHGSSGRFDSPARHEMQSVRQGR
ncbi:uncharacterized protein CCOS01_06970 [Colletotrichum costaricense]|uniref:PhoD-like phosphatase domain-containing protein n=1 Tax=Colletotrichum costaricense TaxID=1209916 RepID=A0AAJ0E1E1_9PEZI|nr:uncharacterized protein CCOS01_06970 [Colletotrichum costaricense]KAK1529136.1 hypothetical protein CCOS01_06970 [Colletotrichum costaricense]